MLLVSSLCCWLPECVDAVNLASSLALTEGMLAAHLLPFTLFMALQIKTTFTHTLPHSPYCTAHLATHNAAHCWAASGPSQNTFYLIFCCFKDPEALCVHSFWLLSVCLVFSVTFYNIKSHHLNPVSFCYHNTLLLPSDLTSITLSHPFLCVLKFKMHYIVVLIVLQTSVTVACPVSDSMIEWCCSMFA